MPSENGFRRHRSTAGNVADIEAHIVERVERAAVADADDDAVGQFLFQCAVEQGLGRFVQSGGGFVEQDDFGLGKQGADEGDALQFARGEFVLPVVGFI